MIDKSLFELPFSHPRDMSLIYQKYGLNSKAFAPFFEPNIFEMIQTEKDLKKYIKLSEAKGDREKPKKKLNRR
jgi:hypothetical protein